METVTISLNGREVAGLSGTTILDLARQVGVTIPTLCHHPVLKSVGACRVCLVEDAKTGRFLASCVTPITKGMEILTDSPAAVAARRGVLELILSDHPSACVVCSKGNECVLRSLAKDHGICDPELDAIRRWMPIQEVNPFIVRDLTKCVLCGRCIRVCKDFEAVGAIEYMERGYNSHPGTAGRTPLEGSECNFCGSCVAICPTDALAERQKLSLSSGKDYAAGICSYCGTGCCMEYELSDGVVSGARGIIESPVNSLSLCVRGHYGQDALSSPARLTDPLIRRQDGTWGKFSWDEALGEVAGRLTEVIGRCGPSSIGIIAGTRCSNDELYLAGRFARSTIGTPNIDSTARFSSGAAVDALADAMMAILPTASLETILEAQTILLVAARPDYSHPVVARNIRQAVRNRGAALVQLDPLVTSLSPFAGIHFREDTDTLPSLLIELMKELITGSPQTEDLLRHSGVNVEELLSCLDTLPKHQAPKEQIREAALLMSEEKKIVFLVGPMASRAAEGYTLIRLVANLAFLCGQPQSVLFLFEGCNELGAWEMGCSPNRLPGCVSLEDATVLEALGIACEADIVAQPGLDVMGMIRGAETGDLKALVFLGVDPLTVFPDTERTRTALGGMELVVRTGLFPAQIEELAEFVFPSAAITEADGTYMSTEGWVQRVSKITDPPGNARPTARFIIDLAGRLGSPMGFLTARDIFEEIQTVCPAWQALTWADVGKRGGMPLSKHDERHVSRDPQENGQSGLYVPADSFPARVQAPPERPWRVFPEELTVHPGDGVVSAQSYGLARFAREDTARMNPTDAARIKAENGAFILVSSEAGEIKVRLSVDPRVPPSGIVIPAGGPRYILQRLLLWPEEYDPPGWVHTFVSISTVEE
ncbi:MAG: molybdopterin-dependent oxidoreductase [Desulfomonile sp.]|nr:molybdopterin-dependent oxidoreductase [Deltaproteobacteria bacterium]